MFAISLYHMLHSSLPLLACSSDALLLSLLLLLAHPTAAAAAVLLLYYCCTTAVMMTSSYYMCALTSVPEHGSVSQQCQAAVLSQCTHYA
jgi:hypothetical protein